MAKIIEISPIQKKDNRKKRVCAYARVSSDSDDQLNSFSVQVEYYTDFISQNPAWEFADIYADEGLTGLRADKRGEFQRMLRDCRKGKIDRILTKSVSRFARNTKECLEAIRELKSLGVSVLFEKENIDTAELSSEMMLAFYSHSAQEESLSISGNMRWSYRQRMESGEFLCTKPPYGYALRNGTLEIDESEAEVIRYIFHSYLSGKSKWEIADELTAQGLVTRDGNTKWYYSTIHYILQNERYCGNALLQKRYTTDTFPFQKLRNKGEKTQYFIRNSHEPIISVEDFERAQQLNTARRSKKAPRQEYPFSQKIKCGECGILYKRKKREQPVWACQNHDRNKTLCPNRNLPEAELYAAFVRLYNKLKLNNDKILLPLLRQLQEVKNCHRKNNARLVEINREMAELSGKILVLNRIKSKGLLDEALYTAQSNETNHRLTELKTEKGRLLEADEDDAAVNGLRLLLDTLDCGPDYLDAFDRDLLDGMVE